METLFFLEERNYTTTSMHWIHALVSVEANVFIWLLVDRPRLHFGLAVTKKWTTRYDQNIQKNGLRVPTKTNPHLTLFIDHNLLVKNAPSVEKGNDVMHAQSREEREVRG